ncbi:MBL fold hydrolase [Mycolicibacterium chubuense]|uniref:MBL fold metallo-hydrolase n=1 Tax=Mycolicibacterium chubuense TaxID=1800 RepID=UPI0006548AB6|nr:MBL fold metallo-hydrolase [Mycolicibacterium chubuense]ORA44442.1 MBL fold hydrolase [Mycolicibacterium chubuense]
MRRQSSGRKIVDNISHRGESAVDELVPSRYALQVGDIDVLVISDGVLPITASTLATNAPPTELAGWLADMFLPPDVLDWALNVVVVRSGGRTILVDAGLGLEFPGFPRAGQMATRLHAAGIDPSAVTDVVLTHMHMDHVGGLLADGLKASLRPDVRIHAAAAEAEFWEAPDFTRTVMPEPVPEVLRSVAARFLDEYRSRLRTFENEYEVAPGVLISRTGGHTPGHSIVRLESRGERLTFAGDAVFAPGFDNPQWHNGFEHDPDEAARVRVRLLRELAATGESLIATHLPFPSICRVAAAGDVFRCVPSMWDY